MSKNKKLGAIKMREIKVIRKYESNNDLYNDLIIYYNKFINDNSLIAGTASICLLIAYKKCNYKKEYIEANLKDIICANEKNKLAYNKLFNNYTITKAEYEKYFSKVIYSFLYDQFLL